MSKLLIPEHWLKYYFIFYQFFICIFKINFSKSIAFPDISIPIFTNAIEALVRREKCFEDLGCIKSDDLMDTLTTLMFSDPDQMNVKFYLYSRQNRNAEQVFNYKPSDDMIKNSFFSGSRKTKLIIHGYMSEVNNNEWISRIKEYILNNTDYNVIAIDWSKPAGAINYFESAANTRVVGAMIAYFINRLINVTNISPKDIHCIGHSLGAQTCGFVGQRFKDPKLGQISGLDPAGPGFMTDDSETRLDPTDADLVTILHTNAGIFTSEGIIPITFTGFTGNSDNLGHFDFWPNGGSMQPGCDQLESFLSDKSFKDKACNHGRSHEYPAFGNRNNCQFIGYECDNYTEFEKGMCADCGTNDDKCKPMDFDFEFWDNFNKTKLKTKNDSTNYYLKTSGDEPYCLLHYQILIQISEKSSSKSLGRLNILVSKDIEISFPNSGVQIWQEFRAGQNQTQLLVDSNEMDPTANIRVQWISLFGDKIRIKRISFNFMSHKNKSVRVKNSQHFCPTFDKTISNEESVVFLKCSSY